MSTIPFTKMQGLGNDFVVLDFINQPIELNDEQFAQIADRRYGVGCDQILIVEPSETKEIDFRYRIINADGSEVGQCGNGARCLAKFVHQQGLTDKTSINVATSTCVMNLRVNPSGDVTVNMGKVSFTPEQVPFDTNGISQRNGLYPISLNQDEHVAIAIANIGNPHCLLLVDDIETAKVEELGKQLESHQRFPEKVNVGFMQMLSPSEIKLRVFERGAGETMACGSGACAAVAMGQKLGLLCENVIVNLIGGELDISLTLENDIMMTGAAEFCFTGELIL